jgi:hypothetical protein
MPFSPRRTHRARCARSGRLTALITAAAACLTLTTVTTTPATAATGPVYSGHGWKANTAEGIYSLNPDPYEIVFADTTARTILAPYFQRPAAQADAVTGITITVTDTIDTTPAGTCPPRHRIVVHYTHRPAGTAGYSLADPCYQISDRSAWGGHIHMDSEYWTEPAWFSSDPAMNDTRRRNAVAHELGHILGLAHPNTDLDHDGTVEQHECVKNPSGWYPVLCFPNGGYRYLSASGQYVAELDVVGLKQMAANWYARQGL